jgi:hypothetical protein
MNHPHPDKRHVMVAYRQFILGTKRKFGTARSFVHYKDIIQSYLTAKRQVLGAAVTSETSASSNSISDEDILS